MNKDSFDIDANVGVIKPSTEVDEQLDRLTERLCRDAAVAGEPHIVREYLLLAYGLGVFETREGRLG